MQCVHTVSVTAITSIFFNLFTCCIQYFAATKSQNSSTIGSKTILFVFSGLRASIKEIYNNEGLAGFFRYSIVSNTIIGE